MKKTLLISSFVLFLGYGSAQASESKAPQMVKNIGGCFSVSYRFVEDGSHDYEIPKVHEWITVKDSEKGVPVVQHYGVYLNEETKKFETMVHFYEEWTTVDGKNFVQRVFGPSGNFRYECASPARFGQMQCQSKGAPRPLRDIKRKDYDKLNRGTTLQITPRGWVQNEINDKVKKDGTVVATEVGWIEYRRIESNICDVAKKEYPQE